MPHRPSDNPFDRGEGAERPAPDDYLREMRLDRQPNLLPATDVAVLLGVARQTVYHLVHSGELSGIRVGRHALRIFKQSLIDYVRRRLV